MQKVLSIMVSNTNIKLSTSCDDDFVSINERKRHGRILFSVLQLIDIPFELSAGYVP